MRTPDTKYVVKVTNTQTREVETHYFATKEEAERFRKPLKPGYRNAVLYPIHLYDKLQ